MSGMTFYIQFQYPLTGLRKSFIATFESEGANYDNYTIWAECNAVRNIMGLCYQDFDGSAYSSMSHHEGIAFSNIPEEPEECDDIRFILSVDDADSEDADITSIRLTIRDRGGMETMEIPCAIDADDSYKSFIENDDE